MTDKKHSVVLADDHQLVLDGFKSIITTINEVEVVAAVNSGDKVIEVLENRKVDLVITDIEMPVMDGITLAKKIKKEFPLVKVMMVSMYQEPHLLKQLMRLDVDGYILKTDDTEEWTQAIHNILRGKKYFSSRITQILVRDADEPGKHSDGLSQLTKREVEVLTLITRGLSNKQIGEELFISHKTVDSHRTSLMEKLDIHNVANLIRFALENKIQ